MLLGAHGRLSQKDKNNKKKLIMKMRVKVLVTVCYPTHRVKDGIRSYHKI